LDSGTLIVHIVPGFLKSHRGWNISCDMCVNGKRSEPRIAYSEGHEVVIPMENMIWIPEDWPDDETAEYYYGKLPKMSNCQCQDQGQGQGDDRRRGEPGDDTLRDRLPRQHRHVAAAVALFAALVSEVAALVSDVAAAVAELAAAVALAAAAADVPTQ